MVGTVAPPGRFAPHARVHARPCRATRWKQAALRTPQNEVGGGQLREERGCSFDIGEAFYRPESAQARDLAVLAASVHRQDTGQLHVLDVMCGSGVRAARYLRQAGANSVWSNDLDTRNHGAILRNAQQGLGTTTTSKAAVFPHLRAPVTEVTVCEAALTAAPAKAEPLHPSLSQDQSPSALFYTPAPAAVVAEPLADLADPAAGPDRRCIVSHVEGKRLLTACYMAETFHDLIDVDVFGSDSTAIGPALDAVRFGGLVFLTSTDGFSSSGKRPRRALAAYGAYTRPHPSCNEQGLRMLIGAALREALVRGLVVEPLFSLYSAHGPVFRVMLRVTRTRCWQHYGFVGRCRKTGDSFEIGFEQLGQENRRGAQGSVPPNLSIAGPLWTGSLHNAAFVTRMAADAQTRGWTGHAFSPAVAADVKMNGNNCPQHLERILATMQEEADPRLPAWFLQLRDITKFARLATTPPRDKLVAALREAGYAASCSHVESRAIKTSASMQQVREVCVGKMGLLSRQEGIEAECDVPIQ